MCRLMCWLMYGWAMGLTATVARQMMPTVKVQGKVLNNRQPSAASEALWISHE
jgi:hypothetical protein